MTAWTNETDTNEWMKIVRADPVEVCHFTALWGMLPIATLTRLRGEAQIPPRKVDEQRQFLLLTQRLSLWCDLESQGIDPTPLMEVARQLRALDYQDGVAFTLSEFESYYPEWCGPVRSIDVMTQAYWAGRHTADRIHAVALYKAIEQGTPLEKIKERMSINPQRDDWVVSERRRGRKLSAISQASQIGDCAEKGWAPLHTPQAVRAVLIRRHEIKPSNTKEKPAPRASRTKRKPRAK